MKPSSHVSHFTFHVTMHRFFVSPDAVHDQQVTLVEEQAHQIAHVLRLRPGQMIVALDNAGWEYEVELTQVGRREVMGEVKKRRPVANEPAVSLTLFLALLKGEKFEWVLQKGTEIGVSAFAPVVTARTVVQVAPNPVKMARWRRIIQEAAEQAGRGRRPQLAEVMTFQEAAGQLERFPLALAAWEGATGCGVREALAGGARPERVALLVGPEGGLEEGEVEMAQAAGARVITLGRRILRAETAGIVGAALVLHELGEVG
ncbi:MAG: RsmE family RNA methyltransferase [Chloroflexota bacterium]